MEDAVLALAAGATNYITGLFPHEFRRRILRALVPCGTQATVLTWGLVEKANQKLQSLLALWDEKRGKKAMPSRVEFPVTVLRPWLGNLALIDPTGVAPYFRLTGTNLYVRFGGEMTQQRLDMVSDNYGGTALRHGVDTVRKTRNPVQSIYDSLHANLETRFHELYLPLGHDGEHIDTIFFASYAEQSRFIQTSSGEPGAR